MRERGRRLRLAEGYESQAEKACAEQEQTAGLGHRGKGDLINIVQATAGEIDLKGFDRIGAGIQGARDADGKGAG